VIADGGGEDSAGDVGGTHGTELGGAIKDVADLGPVDEVFAVEDGYAGEIPEGGVDEIVIVADAADAGIGIEAGEDGVEILGLRGFQESGGGVCAGVGEGIELDPRVFGEQNIFGCGTVHCDDQ
jgi:hypothetical protein